MADDPGKHASPLRSLMAEASGEPYRGFASLADAQRDPQGAVILEGDDGGQVYVVVPAGTVACTESDLETLLRDLDALAWPGNDSDMARLVYERRAVGARVAGGMGGGSVTAGGWVHPEFVERGLEAEIREVLAGTRARLSAAARRAPLPPSSP